MKTKTSNKLNILLIAITLLLLFVAGFNAINKTGAWIQDSEQIGFEVNVQTISIVIKQDERTISDKGYIYLGTDTIVADTEYPLNVTITNEEKGEGYYVRFQAFAVVDGVTYNINDCITTDEAFAKDGKWLYTVNTEGDREPMDASTTLTLIEKVKFPASFVDTVQGQYIKLHLFVEGSATDAFGETQE
ncbi:MAG: hypothetical protein IJ371_03765 [Clostridia bacterium]|nr:hypothetical protein [Clostridia bacterium]